MALLHTFGGATACPICGDHCTGFPPTEYSFPDQLPKEASVASTQGITATERVFDANGDLAYGVGDLVPYDRAVELGLVTADDVPTKPKAKPAKRARKSASEKTGRTEPDEDRAHHGPGEDR